MKKIICLFALLIFSKVLLAQKGLSVKISYENPKHILSSIFKPTVGFDLLYINRGDNNGVFEIGVGYRNYTPLEKYIHFTDRLKGAGSAEYSHFLIFPFYFGKSYDFNFTDFFKLNIGSDFGIYYSKVESSIQYSGAHQGGTIIDGLAGVCPKISLAFTDEEEFRLSLQASYNMYFSLEGNDDFAVVTQADAVYYSVISIGLKATFFF